jgi:branched-chain amino acid aminotransferase
MAEEPVVYINGKFLPTSQAAINVYDHGFLYGDGCFEGIRAYNKRVFKLDEHVARMYRSAEKIGLKPPVSAKDFREAILETLRRNKLTDAYIRPIFSRGVGDLGISVKTCRKPSAIVITKPVDPKPKTPEEKSMRLITSRYVRTPPQSLNPNIKSMNYLNNIMAKLEAEQSGADEALLLDYNGHVSEGSAENVFIIKKGELITPTTETVLEGITRSTLMELARERKYRVTERRFKLDEVYSADEMFLTGTLAELVPVTEVDGKKIGDGKPGRITRELMDAFSKFARSEGAEIYR